MPVKFLPLQQKTIVATNYVESAYKEDNQLIFFINNFVFLQQ